ncbi:HAD family phosphatase [uncultured Reyranella sp.]|uniref:HAD family hydrolase n=1 Tax=uncultured Reyranella sp. TaxID=735512 RepID=UPI00259CFA63|nr:HAD family phosphatase [uncultured Reyranella sp.]
MLRKPVEAVLFDMDGLLIDTEAVYIDALQDAARDLGIEMSLDFCHSMIGISGRECDVMIQNFYGAAFRIDRFRERFSGHAKRRLDSHLPVKPGVVEMLDFLGGRGLRLAVATGSGRLTAERHLGKAGLIDRFAAVATRDDVENAKPAPDVYLEAARRLGVAPENCIAFEDSNVGLTAAHAAGTMAFMVPDILPPLPEVRAKCLRVFEDLNEARRLLEESL